MTPGEVEFAELCAKTTYSLLEGASSPEEMIGAARERGLFSIGIADRNGLYGSVRAHVAAGQHSQRHVVGAELLISLARGEEGPRAKVVFLVESQHGYRSLCRILTRAHADLPREEAELSLAEGHLEVPGLFVLLRVPRAPELRRGPVTVDSELAIAGALAELAKGRVFVATSRLFSADDPLREAWARRASRACGLPLLATAEPLFHHPSRKPVADVLQCIRDKTTLDDAGDRLAPNAQTYLRSPREMARLFRDAPERLAITVEIAKACTFSLAELKYSFPCDDALPGETSDAALRRLVFERLPSRYPAGTPVEVITQLEKELALIARIGVAQFFLSVFEIVEIARAKRILCQGRGSAANSAVCYVLGITAVDPARSNLLFERFLSAERGEPPDIDVDFEHERREEVIQAIYAKYGRDRAAMVSEVICYRGKSALRETAKTFGLSLEQADRLSQLAGAYGPVEARADRLREIGFDPRDRRLELLLRVAAELQGFPRHLSTHVGGFVLSARPLEEICPVEPAKMEGRTVVPWDKDDIDALGFFKVDVLGLGMLTALRKGLELVHAASPEGAAFDPAGALASIPPEDSRVYDAICEADTVGVFQIESRAQMAMLPRMRPRTYYDLVIEVAIVRPGPIQGGMVHPYLRRRAGQEPVTLPHPSLGPILARTLGVPLFQEQVMQIAIVGAGYTAGEADELRRDMAAWKRSAKLLGHETKLVGGFVARGIRREFAERLFSQIQGFGEYGFPESHAASFALLVYASAWLKVHHLLEFTCALLNSQPMGFYSASSLVRDAQRHGVRVLPPDVSRSGWDSSIETSSTEPVAEVASTRPRALRLGLRLVKGIGEGTALRIAGEREREPFRDVHNLLVRARLTPGQADALAEAGALGSLSRARRRAMWQVRAPVHGELFSRAAPNEPEVELPPLPALERLRFDYERLGLSVSDHPMRHLRTQMQARGAVTSRELCGLRDGAKVSLGGLVLSRQRPSTASGVVFVTLEDEDGMANLILPAKLFESSRNVAARASLLFARGKVERTPIDSSHREHPVIHILVERIERLDLPGGLESRSRDFR